MIGDLEDEIIKEGKDVHSTNVEFAEWCEDTSTDSMFVVKSGKQTVADLTATIEKEAANTDVQNRDIVALLTSNSRRCVRVVIFVGMVFFDARRLARPVELSSQFVL